VVLGRWDPDLVDFLIVYLRPDFFYVIPVNEILTGKFALSFFPYGKTHRKAEQYFETYLGRWDLLKAQNRP
jgi:hypothetical protein